MKVTVEDAEVGYKGPKEFEKGRIIADASLPVHLLPEDVDVKSYFPYKHRFRGGAEIYIVDTSLVVNDRSLLMKGLARKRSDNAPEQTILVERFMGKPLPVLLRHEGLPYNAALKFELPNSSSEESDAVRFVKKHYQKLGPYRYYR